VEHRRAAAERATGPAGQRHRRGRRHCRADGLGRRAVGESPGVSYCDIAPGHPFHGPYHDREYGFPVTDDDALFERLVLEINQAGLSWLTILQKREAFRKAFRGFEIERVARMKPERLLRDPGIIRNRLKIEAAIENARRIRAMPASFAAWLESHHPLSKDEW